MADANKKLVTLDILDYYDELNKQWVVNEIEETTKSVVEEIAKSNELEII